MALARAIAKKLSKVDSKKVDEDIAATQKAYEFMEGRKLDRAGIEKENEKLNALFRKTSKELEAIKSKKSADTAIGQQARNELDRRAENKMAKKGDPNSEYASFEPFSPTRSKKTSDAQKTPKDEKAADRDAEAFAMGKEQTEKKSAKSLTAAEKKAAEESLKFKRGGLVTKKKAPAKAQAPSTPSRSHPLNKFYGK